MSDPREPIFAAIREASASNPFNVPGRVQQLHDLLDSWGVKSAVVAASRRVSAAGIKLLHDFEGFARKRPDGRVEAYLCPAGVWTIGWGSTGPDPFNGGQIRKGTIWTRDQAEQRFRDHLREFEIGVDQALAAPTTPGQFDALVSLAYNIGLGAFRSSTLLRLHNARDYAGAAGQFARWNKGDGKVLPGLTRRRAAEAALYRS